MKISACALQALTNFGQPTADGNGEVRARRCPLRFWQRLPPAACAEKILGWAFSRYGLLYTRSARTAQTGRAPAAALRQELGAVHAAQPLFSISPLGRFDFAPKIQTAQKSPNAKKKQGASCRDVAG